MAEKTGGAGKRSGEWVELLGGGAAGVGLVLVLLPMLAIVLGVLFFKGQMIIGLPVLAILGIMILLGTLSLVAMLFKRLELADPQQPLALPPGSMRAAIALSLIVLFAIFSITLFLSIAAADAQYAVNGLRESERNSLVLATPSRVVQSVDDGCAVPNQSPCATENQRFKVILRAPASSEGIDFAKQLLVLVGTLMTSVTSYYFAARAGAETGKQSGAEAAGGATGAQAGGGAGTGGTSGMSGTASGAAASHSHGTDPDDADGCDVEILDATADEHLPVATGGVAAKEA